MRRRAAAFFRALIKDSAAREFRRTSTSRIAPGERDREERREVDIRRGVRETNGRLGESKEDKAELGCRS